MRVQIDSEVVQCKDWELKLKFIKVLELFKIDLVPEVQFVNVVCFAWRF